MVSPALLELVSNNRAAKYNDINDGGGGPTAQVTSMRHHAGTAWQTEGVFVNRDGCCFPFGAPPPPTNTTNFPMLPHARDTCTTK